MKTKLLTICLLLFTSQVFAEECKGDYWDNCQGIDNFSSGNKYVGEFQKNQRHGQGIFTYSNGDQYVGEFKHNVKDGLGTFTWSNGSQYVGEWEFDDFGGKGTLTIKGGTKQDGYWINGKYAGPEPIYDSLYESFDNEGYLDMGKYQEEVKAPQKLLEMFKESELDWNPPSDNHFAKFLPNSILNTEKYNAYKDCKGRDVTKYSNCFGTYAITSKKMVYRGTFQNGQFDGLGYLVGYEKNFTELDYLMRPICEGDCGEYFIYYGQFKEGKYDGLGNYFKKGEFLGSGEWEDMLLNGFGAVWYVKKKAYYVGQFKNNLKNGLGQQTWPDGEYSGEWKDGFFYGWGEFTDKESGSKKFGRWISGNYVGK